MTEAAIETPRLFLRKMHASDLESLMAIFGDPKVMEAFNTLPFNHEQMETWLNRNLEHQERFGYGLFSVILKSNQTLIGDCGLEHMELNEVPETELGYDFRSDYWNQGYATEAAAAVRDFAFHTLQLPALISLIRAGNEASKRVAEKIDMRLLEELTLNGIDYCKYGISR
jgi:ribosomal-protein-alanine N-acetyltransferase